MFNAIETHLCRYCGLTFRLKAALWTHLLKEHKHNLQVDFGKVSGNYKKIMNPSWKVKK